MNQPQAFAQMPGVYDDAMSIIYPYYFGKEFQAREVGWSQGGQYQGGGDMYGPQQQASQLSGLGMPLPSSLAYQPGGFDFRSGGMRR